MLNMLEKSVVGFVVVGCLRCLFSGSRSCSKAQDNGGSGCQCTCGGPEEVKEVRAVEPPFRVLGCLGQGGFEALDRPPAAFHMGVVGREHAQLRCTLLDDPPDVLGGIGGESH